MNYNLIAQVILFCSSIGLIQIIFRKMSVLSSLPEDIKTEVREGFFTKVKKELKEKNPLEKAKYEDLLGKVLKNIRIVFLKTDNKIFGWTQRLKEDSQRRKIREDGDYWDRIKRDTEK